MATYKISQLTTATAVSATNQFEINQNGTSKSVEVSVIDVYIKSISNLPVVVSVSSASDALRITQTGTGKALVVEDSANPDATPFVIDASGNVGIGTSSPAYTLDINSIAGWGANQTAPIANIVGANAPTNGGGNLRVLSNTSATADAGGSLVLGGYYTAQTNSIDYAEISGRKQTGQTTGGYLALSTRADLGNETERLRITSTGNVGIGTGAPSQKLEVFAASNSLQIQSIVRNDQAGSGVAAIGFNVSSSGAAEATSTKAGIGLVRSLAFGGGSLCFYNNNSGAAGDFTTADEKMRIDSSGEVYIAGTTDQGAYNLQVNGTGVWGAGAYVNGSDARIKDDIAPLASGLDVVAKLKPVQFRYKENWTKDTALQPGFVAQDLQEALKDQPYIDGVIHQGPEYMSVSYQTLIPVLTKAIQELKADFDAYKAAHP